MPNKESLKKILKKVDERIDIEDKYQENKNISETSPMILAVMLAHNTLLEWFKDIIVEEIDN